MVSLVELPSGYVGFEPARDAGPAPALAVVLHGSVDFETGLFPKPLGRESLAGVISAVREAYGEGKDVDVYAPALPYVHLPDGSGGQAIVTAIVGDLDYLWTRASESGAAYQKIVFIGHCVGGTILRRVFLAGSYNSPDYDAENSQRDDLYEAMKPGGLPRPWIGKVDRILLLASWEKGWSVSPRTGWWFSFWLNLIGGLGRVTELCRPYLKATPFRTVLDMRQGAPFIVQTRLIWMAYRRWLNPEALQKYNEQQPERRLAQPPADANNPLVVQIIGSRDDFVSPQEQIDCDAEGTRRRRVASARETLFSVRDGRRHACWRAPSRRPRRSQGDFPWGAAREPRAAAKTSPGVAARRSASQSRGSPRRPSRNLRGRQLARLRHSRHSRRRQLDASHSRGDQERVGFDKACRRYAGLSDLDAFLRLFSNAAVRPALDPKEQGRMVHGQLREREGRLSQRHFPLRRPFQRHLSRRDRPEGLSGRPLRRRLFRRQRRSPAVRLATDARSAPNREFPQRARRRRLGRRAPAQEISNIFPISAAAASTVSTKLTS